MGPVNKEVPLSMIAFCTVVTEELPKVMKSRPTLGVNEDTESRYTVNSAQFTNEEKLPRNISVGGETENNKMNMICVMPIIGRHGLHIHVLRRNQEQKHRPRQVPSEFCLGPRDHAILNVFPVGRRPVDWPGFSLDPANRERSLA